MSLGRMAASAVIVAVLATKVVEIAWGINSWPVSNVPMFSGKAPPGFRPTRARLIAQVGGTTREVTGQDLGLDEVVLRSRLTNARDKVALCGALGRTFVELHPSPAQRLTALEVRIEYLPRPGLPPLPPRSIPCPLGEQP